LVPQNAATEPTVVLYTGDLVTATDMKTAAPDEEQMYRIRVRGSERQGWVPVEAVSLFEETYLFRSYIYSTYVHDVADPPERPVFYDEAFLRRALRNPHLSRLSRKLVLLHGGRFGVVLRNDALVYLVGDADTSLNAGDMVVVAMPDIVPEQVEGFKVVLEEGVAGTMSEEDLFAFGDEESWNDYIYSTRLPPELEVTGFPEENVSRLFSREFLEQAGARVEHTMYGYSFQQRLNALPDQDTATEESPQPAPSDEAEG